MKRELRGFIMGVIVSALLMSSVVLATPIEKMIEVVFNKVNITVNEEKVEADNILYQGTTYVPLRAISEILDKEVNWDGKTNTASINDSTKALVTRVVDGDTIIVDFNGKEERVRLIGIDTPESVHPDKDKNVEFGKVASEFTRTKLEGKEVKLEFDAQERDRYGRILAYVYMDGKMFNKTLLEEGYAKIATFPPNVKYVSEFTEIEKTARENKKGLWNIVDLEKSTEDNSNPHSENNSNVEIKNYGLKVKAGEYATATIKGTPNVEYKINVYYSSGASKAKGLEPKKADSDGNISWTWQVGSKTKAGKYKIVVIGDKTEELELEVIE